MFTPVLAKAISVCPPGMLASDSHFRMIAIPILDNSENSIWFFPINFLHNFSRLPRVSLFLYVILTFCGHKYQNTAIKK